MLVSAKQQAACRSYRSQERPAAGRVLWAPGPCRRVFVAAPREAPWSLWVSDPGYTAGRRRGGPPKQVTVRPLCSRCRVLVCCCSVLRHGLFPLVSAPSCVRVCPAVLDGALCFVFAGAVSGLLSCFVIVSPEIVFNSTWLHVVGHKVDHYVNGVFYFEVASFFRKVKLSGLCPAVGRAFTQHLWSQTLLRALGPHSAQLRRSIVTSHFPRQRRSRERRCTAGS